MPRRLWARVESKKTRGGILCSVHLDTSQVFERVLPVVHIGFLKLLFSFSTFF